ncbi:MAG: chondroitinase-B domain-containing protein [Bacteroidota bacterium]
MPKIFSVIFLLAFQIGLSQTRFDVSSLAEFNAAHASASAGDSIVWKSGNYSDIFMDITKDDLIVTAAFPGTVVFDGASKVEIDGDHVTFSGLQFIGGNIGTDHVIRIWGDDVLVTEVNIANYTSYKYLIVDEESQRTTISYSNFENRINLDDQNILSILVDENVPGYHTIHYCSFKNFEGTGNDMGIEPIRIGVSTQARFNSRTIVEYCYFTNCDGDGELISNKASQNVIRYNTFEDNSKAELVLRHGDEAIVYGNFFLNNMGGVRVREGSNHFIYNNYFEGLDRRSIFLQNESSDPLSDIHVYFNTIVASAEVILGGDGDSNPPENVVIANNIFTDPEDQLFEESTGSETWLGNISNGNLGISRPSGIEDTDPGLIANAEGFYQISTSSAAIDNAESGFPSIPDFPGLDYDTEISLDLMKQNRPIPITSKDVGGLEFTSDLNVRPHVTEENTGPSYLGVPQIASIDIAETFGGGIILEPALQEYSIGSTVTATAIANDGYKFTNWTLGLSGIENPIEFVVTADVTISAEFEPNIILSLEGEIDPFLIYPNPSNKILTIDMMGIYYTTATFEVLTLEGRLILKEIVTSSNPTISIDISEIPDEPYILKYFLGSDQGFINSTGLLKFIKN